MPTQPEPPSRPPIIPVLHDIRSTYNVGSILRTAEGFGAGRVIFSGCTPRPEDPALLPHLREKLTRQIHKTALGAENYLELYSSHDIISDLKSYQDKGFVVLGLENNLARPTVKIGSPEFHNLLKSGFQKPGKTSPSSGLILVLGSEVDGIPYALHDIIDFFLEIPMYGQKESFNVSVAAGIALFALTCYN